MSINKKVICPFCKHAFDDNDFENAEHDLWAVATDEDRVYEVCPYCEKSFCIQGGYSPEYETAATHCDL